MTWLWRTCFSCLWLYPALAANVAGHVELVDSRNPGVRKHRDYSGVVVWLEPAGRFTAGPRPKTAVMAQKGKQFIPHVLAIEVGGSVEFPNFDPIFHNAFSNFGGQPFDTGLYPPGGTQKVHFLREGVVHVFCNIHSTMSAVIVVVRTPYIAVTGPSGAYDISDVPAGEYSLRVWHERSTEATLNALARRIVVPEGAMDGQRAMNLPAIRISESGYLEVPHKNKYGQEYPLEPDRGIYPGGPS